MSTLHRLPNGAWVDLTQIHLIQPNPDRAVKVNIGPDVIIIGKNIYIRLPFSSYDNACEYADDLARLVVEAIK